MKRWMPVAAAAAAVALALTGCAGGGAETANTSARGPITFAMGSNDAGKLTPIIEQWNASHPDEQVSLVELPAAADQARETLVQALQAKSTEYDVMALDVVWTAEFAANGWIQPLEGELALDTAGLLPATVESATYHGKLYAAPQNTNAQLLFYRTDLAPQAPANWQALIDSCAAAKTASVDCLVMQLKNYEGLTVQTTQAINAWGGSVVGDDGKTPTVNSPEAKAGLQALADAYAGGQIASRANGFTEEETNLAFLAGETMYAYNWPYMYDTSQKEPTSQVQGKVGVAPIVGPSGPGTSTLGGYNNAININSKYKATALDFMTFVQSPENQAAFADQSFPPVLASVYDDPALQAKYPYLPALKTALENAKPRPVTPFYAAVSKAIHDNAAEAITGAKPVDQALTDMESAITTASGATK